MTLYDFHCHLDMVDPMQGTTVKDIVEGAKAAGICGMITCSTSFQSNEKNISIAEKFPSVKAAIGLYPINVLELSDEELDKAFEFFENAVKREEVVAIGEVGLDFKLSKTTEEKERQAKVFSRFIDLSKRSGKALIIHSRYAQDQVLRQLQSEGAKKVLLHSFVDSPKLMKRAAELGYFVSVGMSVLYNIEVQQRVAGCEMCKLLFETDSPIIFNSERALPQNVADIARKVAELKKTSLEEIEKAQETAYKTLFG
ncbi:MAG: TatD family hydrolase [archaeon]